MTPIEQQPLGQLLEDASSLYQRKGFAGRIGFGASPALIVIDLVGGWTTPSHPLGSELRDVIQQTNVAIKAARAAGRPVIFSTMAYEPTLIDGGVHFAKIPALKESLMGSEAAALSLDLDVVETDLIITKKSFSCFPGTPMQAVLTSLRIDTLLIAGCSTSACVRATATDAMGLGFRPIVIREAVGDRAAGPHVWNLFDIDAKFGDVESIDTVTTYLSRLP